MKTWREEECFPGGRQLSGHVVCSGTQSCSSLSDPVDCSPPGSSVHEVSQARTLDGLPFPPPGELPGPGTEPTPLAAPALSGRVFPTASAGEPTGMLLFSPYVASDSSPPRELQHARLPWPSLSPGACSNPYPLSWGCHTTIASSVAPFSSCPLSFSASGSFPMSRLFTSGGQSNGTSASASVLPMNIQGWFPLGWTGLISLQSKGLSRVFSSTTVQKHQLDPQPSLWSNSHIHNDYWKNHRFDCRDLCQQGDTSAF